ncbi:hypothetical protein JCM11251_003496 [Rhodosporidiobolus azoricus]
MTTHHRTHSLTSSTGSLTDDLVALPTHTSHSDPFYDGYAYGAQGAGDTSMTASEIGDSPYIGGAESRRSSVVALTAMSPSLGTGGDKPGRSRARAFSFLSVHQPYGAREGDSNGISPSTGETPFVGGAYDRAFEHGDLDDEIDALSDVSSAGGDDVEMRPTGETAAMRWGGKAYRSRFQPLEGAEYALMGVSAVCVVGLTVGAVVLTWVG